MWFFNGTLLSCGVYYHTEAVAHRTSEMDTSINNKKHGRNTFTSSSSNCDGEALGDYRETKYSGGVPLTLEPATIPFPEPLTHPECSDTKSESKLLLYQDDQSTLGKGKPSAVVENSISPKVNKLLSDDQLSVNKTCIIHLNRLFNSARYSCTPPAEKCLVIKVVEIAPGLYAGRLEPHNPIDRYVCMVMMMRLLMMY